MWQSQAHYSLITHLDSTMSNFVLESQLWFYSIILLHEYGANNSRKLGEVEIYVVHCHN